MRGKSSVTKESRRLLWLLVPYPLSWFLVLLFIVLTTPLSDTYTIDEALFGSVLIGSIIATAVSILIGVVLFLRYAKMMLERND